MSHRSALSRLALGIWLFTLLVLVGLANGQSVAVSGSEECLRKPGWSEPDAWKAALASAGSAGQT
jgi:hypothetical protein